MATVNDPRTIIPADGSVMPLAKPGAPIVVADLLP
jgi:hypothetical protein